MVLNKKVTVIFAANGAISSAVATSFAREGASVYSEPGELYYAVLNNHIIDVDAGSIMVI